MGITKHLSLCQVMLSNVTLVFPSARSFPASIASKNIVVGHAFANLVVLNAIVPDRPMVQLFFLACTLHRFVSFVHFITA